MYCDSAIVLKNVLMTRPPAPHPVLHLGPNLNQQGGMATVERLILSMTLPGFELSHIPTHEEGSVAHRIRVFLTALGRLRRRLRSDRPPEIVHIHMSERGSVARVMILITLLRPHRRPIVLHTHGAEFHEFFAAQRPWRQRWIARTLRRCQHLIALSDSWGDYYRTTLSMAASRVSVMHNPVTIVPPCDRPLPGPGGPFQLLFLGRIGTRKGAFHLLRAFALASAESPIPLRLTLGGDGEVEAARALAAELGIGDQVAFAGWAGGARLTALLREAHAFILPSLNEGLPMAILEAMSHQLPILASAVGGIPEVVIPGETGFLLDPHQPDAIAQTILTLARDPALAARLGRGAYQHVQRFSDKKYQISLLELYRSLFENR
jgi:glycosyltransferase involved in cell wall biosynthesis